MFIFLGTNEIFSTLSKINPLKYSGLNIVGLNVHGREFPTDSINQTDSFPMSDAGEIWANMLHNVYAALVNMYGFSPTARTNPYGREGNIVFLRLFMDGLSKQSCYPTCKCRAHHVMP